MRVEYQKMHEELSDAEVLHSRMAYVEADDGLELKGRPVLVLITEKNIYFGGTKDTSYCFFRIRLDEVGSVSEESSRGTCLLNISYLREKTENRILVRPTSKEEIQSGTGEDPVKELGEVIRNLAHIR
ncbi:MAG: hypothetical protein ABH950_03405 [Candidatus Altiarchaeota archaeon]